MATTASEALLDATPVAVLDFETTGLCPPLDRVVEVSVVHAYPDGTSELVLDTLVDPERPVTASEVHGITDADVVDAPTFGEIAGDLARVLADCMLAAYNVAFDLRFLRHELAGAGWRPPLPHVCLMYMRPMLGLGKRRGLAEACRDLGIDHSVLHRAALDAFAAAKLWTVYLEAAEGRGIRTFGDLAQLKNYKFVDSFSYALLTEDGLPPFLPCDHLKPRPVDLPPGPARTSAEGLGEYWDALTVSLADLELTREELATLGEIRDRLGLSEEHLRTLHTRAFAARLNQALEDERVTDREWRDIGRLHACLKELGWAPGGGQ